MDVNCRVDLCGGCVVWLSGVDVKRIRCIGCVWGGCECDEE
jgi:hypothetical protein